METCQCSRIQLTHAHKRICAHKHTHTFLDGPTSQWELVLCQIGNWQTGKSQIILSQLDRDGLSVKMLLGSLRPWVPKTMDDGQDLFHCTLLRKRCVEDEIAETFTWDRNLSSGSGLQRQSPGYVPNGSTWQQYFSKCYCKWIISCSAVDKHVWETHFWLLQSSVLNTKDEEAKSLSWCVYGSNKQQMENSIIFYF